MARRCSSQRRKRYEKIIPHTNALSGQLYEYKCGTLDQRYSGSYILPLVTGWVPGGTVH